MRTLLFVLLFALAGLSLLFASMFEPDEGFSWNSHLPDYGLGDLFSIWAQGQQIDNQANLTGAFHQTLEQTKQDLLAGKLSLAEGAERVLARAEQCSALYLSGLRDNYPGKSDQERVARSLFQHLTMEFENGNWPAAPGITLARFRDELDRLGTSQPTPLSSPALR
jgi:hypothetical protein